MNINNKSEISKGEIIVMKFKGNFKERLNRTDFVFGLFFLLLTLRNLSVYSADVARWFGFLAEDKMDIFFILGTIVVLVLVSFSKPSFNIKLIKVFELILMAIFLFVYHDQLKQAIMGGVILTVIIEIIFLKVGGLTDE